MDNTQLSAGPATAATPKTPTTASTSDEPSNAARFSAWVEPHWLSMARLSMRMAPAGRGEDVLQDALSAAWLHWAQYDAGRGTPRNWLLAIVANEGRPARRREHSPDLALSQVSAPQPTDRAATPIDVPVGVDLARALARLTDRQRLCVELYYFLGLPVADVAVVMSCSAGTAKSTLADARLKLRGYLGEDYR